MIQFKRGKTTSWLKNKTKLAEGQPGYDKDKHKLKIGDGKSSWAELPYAGGLSGEEILSSETEAQVRRKAALLLNPLAALIDSPAVITYGEESPSKNTVGQLYLQYYDADPEVDYVVESGVNGGWQYRKWYSGRAECFGTHRVSTKIQEQVGSVYCSPDILKNTKYPITFTDIPTETATLQSPGNIIWLASKGLNTKSNVALYTLVSPYSHTSSVTCNISIYAIGFWK